MNKCLNCDKPIVSIEGRKPRQFCKGTNCRTAYWKKHNPKEKLLTVSLPKDFVECKKVGFIDSEGKIIEVGTPQAVDFFKALSEETLKMYSGAISALSPFVEPTKSVTVTLTKDNYPKEPTGRAKVTVKADSMTYNGDEIKGEVIDFVELPKVDIEATQQRIAQLKSELKSPPSTFKIGKKIWFSIRENELKTLEQLLLNN